jgi:hypothetical protein
MVEKKKTPTKVKQRKNRLTGEELGPVSQGAQDLAAMDSILKKGIAPIASSIANTTSRNVRGAADILGAGAQSALNTTSRNVRGIADILGMGTASGASNSSGANAYLADTLMNDSMYRDNNIVRPEVILDGSYDPYGVEKGKQFYFDGERTTQPGTSEDALQGLRDAIQEREDKGKFFSDGGPRRDGWMAQMEQDQADELAASLNTPQGPFNQGLDTGGLGPNASSVLDNLQSTPSGPSAESLFQQLANSQSGGAQGRFNELIKFLGTEGARRNNQIDSDEAAILKQLQGSDSRRRAGEDFYRDRRAGEFGELEGRMNTYQSAGSRRLIDLGIDPQLYTSAVGQQMGTLLGAQMQSGNDLMNRMAMLGAERAEGATGRASAGMSKERRVLDASVASMMFEGSQTLSMELQSINEALMNRRIDAATAQRAIDAKTREAAQKAQAANSIYLALNPGGDPNTGANLNSLGVFDDFFKEKIKPEDTPELTQIITQDFIDTYGFPQNILGAELTQKEIQNFANLGKTTAQTNEMNFR